MPDNADLIVARRYRLSGRVQGLGVRPAIARLAARLSLAGHVSNDAAGVTVIVEGLRTSLERFDDHLLDSLPAVASVEGLERAPADVLGRTAFVVTEDAKGPSHGIRLAATVPQDRVLCEDCLHELFDPTDRRFRYPFTSCTVCGPRYSILTAMPYERRFTSMTAFPMCDACRSEHDDPADRRFHAQTICCPACGPRIWLEPTVRGPAWGDPLEGSPGNTAPGALAAAAAILKEGGIVALRGLGGYQFLCDATNDSAVARLRARKSRPTKPLAVMVDSLAAAERIGDVEPAERAALLDAANPIVLLRARDDARLSLHIHRGLRDVGVMLPTTPLHALVLRDAGRPLAATSGNSGGDPLTCDIAEAQECLGESVDAFLHHDRDIVHRVDDSVVRVIAGRRVTLRLARGLAPLPLPLTPCAFQGSTAVDPGVVALGGHQKSAIAVSNGQQAILGPHLGDLDSPATRRRFHENLGELTRLLGCEPQVLVHDLHPDYFTTRFAAESPLPKLAVQHHHAHVVAAMSEHGWLDREVLGIAFDGTGYGPDGTIWGGEILRCTATGYRRAAHLRRFRLPGGERAIREPWRAAVALLAEADMLTSSAEFPHWFGIDPREAERIGAMCRESRPRFAGFTPETTSAGRLFDAASALILNCTHADEEGRPAMLLESHCDGREPGHYPFDIEGGAVPTLNWSPMLREVMADRNRGEAAGRMAMRFHRGLADGVARLCERFPGLPVVLTGGVFQNRLLTELLAERLRAAGRIVGLPGVIPPNDGGLAAGQLAIALARIASGDEI